MAGARAAFRPAIFDALSALWYDPVVFSVGGYPSYSVMMNTETQRAFRQTSLFFGASVRSALSRAVQCIVFLRLTAGLAICPAQLSHWRKAARLKQIVFGMSSVVPALVFFLFIQPPKAGYFLMALPSVLWAAGEYVEWQRAAVVASPALGCVLSWFRCAGGSAR